MSYADRETTGSRIVAIVFVAFIVAGFGYAFVTGLAVDFATKVADKLNTFDVTPPPPPPPPDKPPPPPPDQPNLPPPPTTVVVPQIDIKVPPQVQIQTDTVPRPQPTAPPQPVTPAPAPAPAGPRPVAVPGGPKGNPGSWFTDDDFPADAKRAGASGRVAVLLSIDTGGRVVGCNVTASSGNSSLDSTTCRLAQRRGRFNVRKDVDGNAQAYTWPISTRWVLRDE